MEYTQVIANCPVCEGTGYSQGGTCLCLLIHRIRVYMNSGGFPKNIIDYVLDPQYTLPVIDQGENSLNYFVSNPELVLDRGLSLYLFSREAGRGKTCLAVYLVKELARHFLQTDNYRSGFSFGFQTANDLLEDSLTFEPLELWKTSTIYVLDDLGNENRATKQKKEAVAPTLQRVLQYRRNEALPTLFTSNYVPETLGDLYEGRIDSLLEIGVDGVIHGNLFRQVEVGGGEDLRTLNSAWDD